MQFYILLLSCSDPTSQFLTSWLLVLTPRSNSSLNHFLFKECSMDLLYQYRLRALQKCRASDPITHLPQDICTCPPLDGKDSPSVIYMNHPLLHFHFCSDGSCKEKPFLTNQTEVAYLSCSIPVLGFFRITERNIYIYDLLESID